MKQFSTRPYPIRLQKETYVKIQKVGKKLGLCASAIIRLSIALQLDAIDAGSIDLTLARKIQ
jgi:hypothetical protein